MQFNERIVCSSMNVSYAVQCCFGVPWNDGVRIGERPSCGAAYQDGSGRKGMLPPGTMRLAPGESFC